MTIKKFAQLCGCNPQTLRHYDHVGLLKPVKVDEWSGYRYYEEEQALTFVKIKNLQKAGFTIEEIKGLLDKDDHAIYEALDAKIAETEERLQVIKEIRRSYHNEMNEITKKINEMRMIIAENMKLYDPAEEFGLNEQQHKEIRDKVEMALAGLDELDYEELMEKGFKYEKAAEQEEVKPEFFEDPDYEVIYEREGWKHVKEFLDDIKELEDGGDYGLYFVIEQEKYQHAIGFMNTIMNYLLIENAGIRKSLACKILLSEDGRNYFKFYKNKNNLERGAVNHFKFG